MRKLLGFLLAGMVLMSILAGCKKYEGEALSGEAVGTAMEQIVLDVIRVEEGSRTDTRVYVVQVKNESEYALVNANVSMTYQVLIPEKGVEYSGGELFVKENPFSLEAGETKDMKLEAAVYDPASLEGERGLLKLKGYLDNQRPENQIMLSEMAELSKLQ